MKRLVNYNEFNKITEASISQGLDHDIKKEFLIRLFYITLYRYLQEEIGADFVYPIQLLTDDISREANLVKSLIGELKVKKSGMLDNMASKLGINDPGYFLHYSNKFGVGIIVYPFKIEKNKIRSVSSRKPYLSNLTDYLAELEIPLTTSGYLNNMRKEHFEVTRELNGEDNYGNKWSGWIQFSNLERSFDSDKEKYFDWVSYFETIVEKTKNEMLDTVSKWLKELFDTVTAKPSTWSTAMHGTPSQLSKSSLRTGPILTEPKSVEKIKKRADILDRVYVTNEPLMRDVLKKLEAEGVMTPKYLKDLRLYTPDLYQFYMSISRGKEDQWKTDLSADMGELGF